MLERSHAEAIADARARFDAGEHRAAWDALLVRARRHPDVVAYRDALSALYRRAGQPDQAARWGAHDAESLDDRERRALRRSLAQFRTEAEVRRYLVLVGALPSIATEHLGSQRSQRLARFEPSADSASAAAAIVGGFFGCGVGAFAVVIVVVLAFNGDPDAQIVAQLFVTLELFVIVVSGLLLLASCFLRARWVRSGLVAAVVACALIALAHVRFTGPSLFG